MCVFTNEEAEFLKKWGNENAAKVWLRNYKKSLYPEPNPKDTQKLKEYMKVVYDQKRFYAEEDEESESSSSESSSEEEERPKEEKKVRKPVKPAPPPPSSKATVKPEPKVEVIFFEHGAQ